MGDRRASHRETLRQSARTGRGSLRGDNAPMCSTATLQSLPLRLLAIETSTDRMSVAVGGGTPDAEPLCHEGPGAAQSSAHLLPTVGRLLAQAGLSLKTLDAVVFARGPGSFTGLRTACAVAQGLGYGAKAHGRPAGLPVLPVDTLLVVAEEARWLNHQAGGMEPSTIVAMLDARMGELYVAAYALRNGLLVETPLQPARLCAPGDMADFLRTLPAAEAAPLLLAGNVFETYGEGLSALPGERQTAWPTATALLRLAPALWAAGRAVAAQDAMPLYVRDKVAQTTDERERHRQAQLAAAAAALD